MAFYQKHQALTIADINSPSRHSPLTWGAGSEVKKIECFQNTEIQEDGFGSVAAKIHRKMLGSVCLRTAEFVIERSPIPASGQKKSI